MVTSYPSRGERDGKGAGAAAGIQDAGGGRGKRRPQPVHHQPQPELPVGRGPVALVERLGLPLERIALGHGRYLMQSLKTQWPLKAM